MDLLAFIRTADPTKVTFGERQRDKDEPKFFETTVRRVVPLLPVAPDRSSGVNIAEAEVATVVRTSMPIITSATTTTPIADPADIAKEKLVGSFVFVYVPQWNVTNGYCLDDGGVCREMVDEFAPPKFFASIREMDHGQLFTEFNVGAARQISVSAEVRMRAEYHIKEKRRLKAVVREKNQVLKARDEKIDNLKATLLLKEAEATEAIRLRAKTSKLEAAEKSLSNEVTSLNERNTVLEKERNALDVKVTDLQDVVVSKDRELTDSTAQLTSIKSHNDNLA
nr:hypothetical protein [Tanacetum cinerariifolium]